MTLATCAEGDLWAADVFYASAFTPAEGLDLLFVSAPDSRHARHMAATGRAAATISAEATRWRDIKGVQLEAGAARLGFEEIDTALEVYITRFPWLREMLRGVVGSAGPNPQDAARGGPALVRMEVAGRTADVGLWRLRTARLLFVDNSVGFAHRSEVVLADGPSPAPS